MNIEQLVYLMTCDTENTKATLLKKRVWLIFKVPHGRKYVSEVVSLPQKFL